MKLKKILETTKDFLLNIIAALLSTGCMQLVLYPALAKQMSAADYGEMLTVMGVFNVVLLAFGNNLSYSRLLQEKNYVQQGQKGDFQVLALIMMGISGLVMLVSNVYFQLPAHIILAIVAAMVLSVWKAYYIVTYRIKLEYGKNLIANLWMSVGYIVGAFVLIRFLPWPWVFALSAVAGLIYIWFSSDIMREPYTVTPLFKASGKVVFWLVLSGMMGNLVTYLDRFIIHPILGSESVSVYATAAFFAKSINLVFSPITTVLLSYITGGKLVLDRKKYLLINLALLALGAVGFGGTLLVGGHITNWLYPTLYPLAKDYFAISSLGIILGIAGSFMSVPVLAYAPAFWQPLLAGIRLVMYFVLGWVLVSMQGILGMCLCVLITNIVGNAISFTVGWYYITKKSRQNA